MNIKKTLIGGAAALGLSTSALAVNVGGVVWDPDSFFDFTSNSNLIEDLLDPGPDGVFMTADDVVDTLNGFGLVTGINGTNESAFCPSGCELTYEFGGFTVASFIPDGGGARIGFTGGWVNFYVDSATAYDPGDKSTAVDGGAPWLSLTAHETLSGIHGIMTSIDATLSTYGGGTDAGLGGGLLDVVGGAAMANFDTDTQTDGADWVFSTSFQPIPAGPTPDGLELFGTADFRGTSIPEPSSIAILGLGLLGLAGASRRRQK
ncbi:PEP-CTERM sorting domain-containing protein [Neptunicella sp.]|uniref:PEP-CTERM sorting domain-containing protein n=1 Tax=Neptunicella sp. TaxID=2125986 RepID=UPI003F693BA2